MDFPIICLLVRYQHHQYKNDYCYFYHHTFPYSSATFLMLTSFSAEWPVGLFELRSIHYGRARTAGRAFWLGRKFLISPGSEKVSVRTPAPPLFFCTRFADSVSLSCWLSASVVFIPCSVLFSLTYWHACAVILRTVQISARVYHLG